MRSPGRHERTTSPDPSAARSSTPGPSAGEASSHRTSTGPNAALPGIARATGWSVGVSGSVPSASRSIRSAPYSATARSPHPMSSIAVPR